MTSNKFSTMSFGEYSVNSGTGESSRLNPIYHHSVFFLPNKKVLVDIVRINVSYVTECISAF